MNTLISIYILTTRLAFFYCIIQIEQFAITLFNNIDGCCNFGLIITYKNYFFFQICML